jgi:hypothetical protein
MVIPTFGTVRRLSDAPEQMTLSVESPFSEDRFFNLLAHRVCEPAYELAL